MKSTQEQKTIHTQPFETSRLDVNPDPKHFSYKVVGLLSWGVLIFCFTGLVAAPRLLLEAARLVAIYMMVRFIAFTVLYLAGVVKIRHTENRVRASPSHSFFEKEITRQQAVHHLVILPNFNEPQEILSRTLRSLSLQEGARHSMTVVLGMEEREPGSRDKAEALQRQYKDSFYCLLSTFHPSDLPKEVPGKGTNETWAARQARQELVDRRGFPMDEIVVTAADSDAIIHPGYLAELTCQFAADPRRHSVIWQAPILLDNDIWHTHAIIRLVTFFSNAISIGDYFNPWEAKVPYSTYSISLKLLEEVNYWDPTATAEDVNLFMRSFFKKGGQAYVQRITLPVHCNPTYGVNLWHAIGIFYIQKVRQGRGGAEIGTLLQKWNYPQGAPFLNKIWHLLKLIHDHLFFSTAGFIVALGSVVSIVLDHSAVITLPPASFSPALFTLLNFLGGASLVVIWLTERVRLSRGWKDWKTKILLEEIASWVIFPVLFFLLMNLPGLQAQTQMLLGRPFIFNRTPKGFDSRIGD